MTVNTNSNTLTIKSPDKLVVMTSEEYEGLMETVEIMRDPDLMEQLRKSDEDFKKGNFITLEELEKELGFANCK